MVGTVDVYANNFPWVVYASIEKDKFAEMLSMAKKEIMTQWIVQRSSGRTVLAKHIVEEVMKYPNPVLLLSIIEVESKFNSLAVSKKGALGLGQIMYKVHKDLLLEIGIKEERELFEVDKNIRATSCILQMYLVMSKMDVERALYRYVGGKIKWYVNKVFANYVDLSVKIEGRY